MTAEHPPAGVVRVRFALLWAAKHFVLSALVIGFAAYVVFGLWYPAPWRDMLGVADIFIVVALVDLVCGPLVTLVLASPHKSSRERWLDLSLVALVQTCALCYGLWSVHSARPVALVFEVDRLFVLTANEVQTDLLPHAPEGLQKLPSFGVLKLGLREAGSGKEYLESIEQSLQGVTQAMRPNWWREFGQKDREALLSRAKPVSRLMEQKPLEQAKIHEGVRRTELQVGELSYLPLTSSKDSSWVAFLDRKGKFVGYANVDGFD